MQTTLFKSSARLLRVLLMPMRNRRAIISCRFSSETVIPSAKLAALNNATNKRNIRMVIPPISYNKMETRYVPYHPIEIIDYLPVTAHAYQRILRSSCKVFCDFLRCKNHCFIRFIMRFIGNASIYPLLLVNNCFQSAYSQYIYQKTPTFLCKALRDSFHRNPPGRETAASRKRPPDSPC